MIRLNPTDTRTPIAAILLPATPFFGLTSRKTPWRTRAVHRICQVIWTTIDHRMEIDAFQNRFLVAPTFVGRAQLALEGRIRVHSLLWMTVIHMMIIMFQMILISWGRRRMLLKRELLAFLCLLDEIFFQLLAVNLVRVKGRESNNIGAESRSCPTWAILLEQHFTQFG